MVINMRNNMGTNIGNNSVVIFIHALLITATPATRRPGTVVRPPVLRHLAVAASREIGRASCRERV